MPMGIDLHLDALYHVCDVYDAWNVYHLSHCYHVCNVHHVCDLYDACDVYRLMHATCIICQTCACVWLIKTKDAQGNGLEMGILFCKLQMGILFCEMGILFCKLQHQDILPWDAHRVLQPATCVSTARRHCVLQAPTRKHRVWRHRVSRHRVSRHGVSRHGVSSHRVSRHRVVLSIWCNLLSISSNLLSIWCNLQRAYRLHQDMVSCLARTNNKTSGLATSNLCIHCNLFNPCGPF